MLKRRLRLLKKSFCFRSEFNSFTIPNQIIQEWRMRMNAASNYFLGGQRNVFFKVFFLYYYATYGDVWTLNFCQVLSVFVHCIFFY